ncbi:MAG: hydrogenase maturation protease [Thiobacillus sp.]|nr:hydrogenase maturation protease [Thiobacillus sp.]
MSGVRILGIGSPSGDDQAGWLTVDALLASGVRVGDELVIEKLDRPGANLIPLLDGTAWVILIDAMQSNSPIGRIRHFGVEDWTAYSQGLSSHGFGVLAALSLARELGGLPSRLDLYGIEIGPVSPGERVRSEIQAAAQQLAKRIAIEVNDAPLA